MPSHFGLKKIAWLGLAKKQNNLFIVQHYAQQYIQKLRTCFSVFLSNFFSKFG
jgi:hypothetical protein